MKNEYRIRIEQDLDAESPREWDNMGTMVCWHRNYNLGDEQPSEGPQKWRLRLAEEFEPGIEERVERIAERLWDDLKEREELTPEDRIRSQGMAVDVYQAEQVEAVLDRHVIMLPLYLMDHGNITMNTGGFSCPWDSGQVGWIYVTRAKAMENYGWKRITKQREQEVLDHLKAEVSVYAQHLEGDVYGFILESRPAQVYDEDGDPVDMDADDLWEHEDSCWGFFGRDPFENGMAEHIDKEHHELLKEAA